MKGLLCRTGQLELYHEDDENLLDILSNRDMRLGLVMNMKFLS